jgi:hypothetical protein
MLAWYIFWYSTRLTASSSSLTPLVACQSVLGLVAHGLGGDQGALVLLAVDRQLADQLGIGVAEQHGAEAGHRDGWFLIAASFCRLPTVARVPSAEKARSAVWKPPPPAAYCSVLPGCRRTAACPGSCRPWCSRPQLGIDLAGDLRGDVGHALLQRQQGILFVARQAAQLAAQCGPRRGRSWSRRSQAEGLALPPPTLSGRPCRPAPATGRS